MDSARTISATDFIGHDSQSYTFLQDPLVDALMQVVVELGTETWVTRRRLLVLERVMAERGILASEAVETYVPTAEDRAAWQQERDRMVRTVYSALARRPAGGDAAARLAKTGDAPRHKPRNTAPPVPRGVARGPSGV